MLSDLFERNAEWATSQSGKDKMFFKRMAGGQNPEYLWIGCSDSRVPESLVTGSQPGEFFVHRNIANLVHADDINLLSILEFSVMTLNVKHVIVCGHYGCGGVQAALNDCQHGALGQWLKPVRDIARDHDKILTGISSTVDRRDKLCELNVCAQVNRLSGIPIIQSVWKERKTPKIHGCIYNPGNGLLSNLNCSISS